MPLYTYMAIDPKGQNVSGNLPAQDRSSALDQLTRKGLVPVRVDEQAAAAPRAAARAENGGGR
jgi:type II secretory pathway component PulF